jgi:hypothetical protein
MDLRILQHLVQAVESLVMVDEHSKVGSLTSSADIDGTQIMAVHTEKDQQNTRELEGCLAAVVQSL